MKQRLAWMTLTFLGVATLCSALPLTATGRPLPAAIAGLAGLFVALAAGTRAAKGEQR